jgi:AmmeMemoRadiSam system protein B
MPIQVDDQEHSLELHLPFIKKIINKSFSLVPILIGQPNVLVREKISMILKDYLLQSNTLFIISSDFCHWGKRFDYQPCDPKNEIPIYKFVENLDRRGMDLIEQLDYAGFIKYLENTKNTICGRHPILILLKMIDSSRSEFKFKFCAYAQSSKVQDLGQSSVSYSSGFLTSSNDCPNQ